MILLLGSLMGPGRNAGQGADKAGVCKAVMRLQEAWNHHDMKAFADQFTKGADFVNVAGRWWKGRAEIEEKHAAAHATIFRESTLSIDDVQIRFLTPEIAVAHVLTSLAGQKTPDGDPVAPRKAILTQVLKKQNGKWMIDVSQNTDIRPQEPSTVGLPPAKN